MNHSNSQHIALFLGTLAGGGAERVTINLAKEFVKKKIKVDLVVTGFKGPLTSMVPDGVNIVELRKRSWMSVLFYMLKLPIRDWPDCIRIISNGRPKTFKRFPSFVCYLNKARPGVVMSTLDSINIISLWAKYIVGDEIRFVIRQAIFQSKEIQNSDKFFESRVLPKLVKRWYSTADQIISVSKHMSDDLIAFCNLKSGQVSVIYNPIDLEIVRERSNELVTDLEFSKENCQVILAVGRLDAQKDYELMIRAVKLVANERKIQLVILGDGPERKSLNNLVEQIQASAYVAFFGHVSNPYKYMSKCDVFALSSRWEGLPNVLIEALACGCKIVSTNCPSGPYEILSAGRYGLLVEVGDEKQFAKKIIQALDTRADGQALQARANEYELSKISDQYQEVLFSI